MTGRRAILKLTSLRLRSPVGLSRSYASGGHGHGTSYGPKESLGMGFWITAAMVPAGAILYSVSQASDGEEPVLTQWLEKVQSRPEHWADRNAGHTRAVEQAALDKALFNSVQFGSSLRELRYPEAIYNYSPRNISAGSLANMDRLTEFYQKKYWKEEERRQNKLAAARFKSEAEGQSS